MKKIIGVILSLLFFSACRFDYEPTGEPYKSMAISKKSSAFINEYLPQSPFFVLNGKKYFIKEAWLERFHIGGIFRDVFTGDTCLVINLNSDQNEYIDFKQYIKEMGNGPYTIWFNLPKTGDSLDTITVYYKETLDISKKDKKFYLIKKS